LGFEVANSGGYNFFGGKFFDGFKIRVFLENLRRSGNYATDFCDLTYFILGDFFITGFLFHFCIFGLCAPQFWLKFRL